MAADRLDGVAIPGEDLHGSQVLVKLQVTEEERGLRGHAQRAVGKLVGRQPGLQSQVLAFRV